jgi:hypothetical protein
MNLLSQRKPPNFLALLLGLSSGLVCGYALITGKFPIPVTRDLHRFPFVIKVRDPQLFHFWILVSVFYFIALCFLAVVRIDPVEDRIQALPQFGPLRLTGHPRAHLAEGLFGLFSVLVLYLCYAVTLRS